MRHFASTIRLGVVFLSFVFFLALFTTGANAQVSGEDIAKKYGVTFPIGELGNCSDYAQCRTYCDDPVNNTACTEFAKKKGFHKEENLAEEKFLQAAKDNLGCDTASSCMTLCDEPQNYDKCNEFAKKLQISGGYVQQPDKQEIIDKAKKELGCDSYGSCMSFCSQAGNKEKCDNFAQQTGLRGGVEMRGPGGCNSESTCKSYCLDPNNFNQCSKFASERGVEQGQFKGPGGCDSPESCRSYCERNPESCRSYAPGASGRYVPAVCPSGFTFGSGGACTPTDKVEEASSCAQAGKYWDGQNCKGQAPPGITTTTSNAYFQPRPEMGGCSTPGSCYDWCKANPGKCGGFNPEMPRPDDILKPGMGIMYNQPTYPSKPDMGGCTTPGSCYDWCKANPGKCGGFNPDSPRPAETNSQGQYNTTPGSGAGSYRGSYSPAPGTNYSGQGTGTNYQMQPRQDMGGCSTPGGCYDWCKANPGKCGGFNPEMPRPVENYTAPSTYTAPTNYTPPSTQTQPTQDTSTQIQTQTQSTSDTSTQTQSQPAQESQPAPTQDSGSGAPPPSDSGSTPTVQGISTNIFRGIVQTFSRLFSFWN